MNREVKRLEKIIVGRNNMVIVKNKHFRDFCPIRDSKQEA